MQALTENLLDLLASRYQAAARGYRARIEIDYVIEGFTELGEPQDLALLGTVTRDSSRHVGLPESDGRIWISPTLVNDGNGSTKAYVSSSLTTFEDYLVCDLGAAFECTAFKIYATNTWTLINLPQWSSDGTTWNTISFVETGTRTIAPDGATLTFTAPITARYWSIRASATGFHSSVYFNTWQIIGTAEDVAADTIGTTSYVPVRVGIDKSRRMTASQVDIELENELGGIGVSPDSAIRTNAPVRVYEWYGEVANEELVFTGLIDRIHEARDPRNVAFTARDMMKRLIEQTFSASAPQGADEDGAVRTQDNGVYQEKEVDQIVTNILNRAGWPSGDRDITPTSYTLEEYILNDGDSWADCIIGDDKLTGLTGYEAGATEDGTFFFRPTLSTADADSDTSAVPVYSYVIAPENASNLISRNVLRLDHEIDDYDLRTRVKVRGNLAIAVPAWTELWHTNKFTKPVGLWWESTDAGFLKVLDRGTKKIYRLRQSDREKVGTGIWPLDISGDVTYPLGLSGDPADSDRFWVLEARWRVGGGNAASVHKYDASSGAHLAEYSLPDGQWSDLKVTSGALWLTNYGTGKIHKRSKTDGSAISNATTVYNGNNQDNPSGLFADGSTLGLFFYGHARFLLVDESDTTTVDPTNALGITSGKVSTAGTLINGGEMDTATHAHLFACSDDLGIVWKYALTEPDTDAVWQEVVDTDLEDELGFLAGAEDREHDTHTGDADHPYEIRRETITLAKTITNLAQATETAQRALAELGHRREVLDLGIVGHPGLQTGDLLQVTDPVTEIDALYVLDTYRDNMDDRGYLGTIALVPYEPVY